MKDRKFRGPRLWSNSELKKFAHLFQGDIANISGWIDIDKEGGHYKEYFKNKKSYSISNYNAESKGFQGNLENEFFLNLEEDLPKEYINKFDVILNHTVLEHVFEFTKAFSNLCLLTKDIVIIVVPFLQEQHAEYGDYWRPTPLTIKKLFEKNGLELVYINANNKKGEAVYLFAIGSKKPNNWIEIKKDKDNLLDKINTYYIGQNAIQNSFLFNLLFLIQRVFKKIKCNIKLVEI